MIKEIVITIVLMCSNPTPQVEVKVVQPTIEPTSQVLQVERSEYTYREDLIIYMEKSED